MGIAFLPARQLFGRAWPAADKLAEDFTRHGEAVIRMLRTYWTEYLNSIVAKPSESSKLSGGSNGILYHISKEYRDGGVHDESITASKVVVSFVYRI